MLEPLVNASVSRRLAALGLLLLLLCGTGPARAQKDGENKDPGKAAAPTDAAYKLKPGDEVSVFVSPQKNFDSVGIVLPDGVLSVRNVGNLKVSGRTAAEIGKQIFEILNKDLRDPVVTVQVTKVAVIPPEMPEPVKMLKVTVVGAVLKPGPIEVEEGTPVRKAIDIAGGAAKEAILNEILIIHADKSKSLVDLSTEQRLSDPAHNRVLREGDSIDIRFLPPMVVETVEISGAVAKPNSYELKPNMTLKNLIIVAEGMLPLADVAKVQLLRRGEPVKVVDLAEQEKLGLKGEIRLQPGDRVWIPQHENTLLLIGAVQSPGPVPVQQGQTLRDFFLKGNTTANGALDERQANLRDVRLLRGEETIKVNLKEVLNKPDSKDNLALQPGDTIYLPAKKPEKQGSPLGGLPYVGALLSLFRLF